MRIADCGLRIADWRAPEAQRGLQIAPFRQAQGPEPVEGDCGLRVAGALANPQSAIRNPQSGGRVAPLAPANPQSAIRNPQSGGGFTLMELLVVVGIVAILAGLAYPAYQRVIQSGRATGCVSNLRQISVGLNAYLAENNNTMPTLDGSRASIPDPAHPNVIDDLLSKYITNPSVFACPADSGGIAKRTGTSYYWNVAINGQSAANLNFLQNLGASENTQGPSLIPLLADKEGFHPFLANKVNVLYADGHVTKDLSFFTSK